MTKPELQNLLAIAEDLASIAWRLSAFCERANKAAGTVPNFVPHPPPLGGIVETVNVLTKAAREVLDEIPEQALVMTGDQAKAWDKLQAWFTSDNPYFILRGVAGSGKSFMMKKVSQLQHNLWFSAPTNKATAVLSEFLGFRCKTTYSLFGLRMEENEDQLELSELRDLPRLGSKPIIVIDEAGMLPASLVTIFTKLAEERGWRFIFVGDPYQLNPINEVTSKVWKLTSSTACRAMLNEVKRFDNQLLNLSIKIREAIKGKEFDESPIESDNANGEGVYTTARQRVLQKLKKHDLAFWADSKVIAWRNKVVNDYNDLIREALGFKAKFEIGDILLAGSPITVDDHIVAHTDEEFHVLNITTREFTIRERTIVADVLTCRDRDFNLVIPKDLDVYQELLAFLATEAKENSKKHKRGAWAEYWETKRRFHTVRYGYAMTCHRIQGTTVEQIYVDTGDILSNPNSPEAFRMLYVAATRPTKKLIAF